jgi:hypothetical protein
MEAMEVGLVARGLLWRLGCRIRSEVFLVRDGYGGLRWWSGFGCDLCGVVREI